MQNKRRTILGLFAFTMLVISCARKSTESQQKDFINVENDHVNILFNFVVTKGGFVGDGYEKKEDIDKKNEISRKFKGNPTCYFVGVFPKKVYESAVKKDGSYDSQALFQRTEVNPVTEKFIDPVIVGEEIKKNADPKYVGAQILTIGAILAAAATCPVTVWTCVGAVGLLGTGAAGFGLSGKGDEVTGKTLSQNKQGEHTLVNTKMFDYIEQTLQNHKPKYETIDCPPKYKLVKRDTDINRLVVECSLDRIKKNVKPILKCKESDPDCIEDLCKVAPGQTREALLDRMRCKAADLHKCLTGKKDVLSKPGTKEFDEGISDCLSACPASLQGY